MSLPNTSPDSSVSQALSSGSSLENLPAEIRILILRALPDTSALRSLVRSSPSFHAAYLTQRQQILFNVLLNTLPPPTLWLSYTLEEVSLIPELWQYDYDALFLFKKEFFIHFITKGLAARPPKDWVPSRDLDTLVSICRRHWLIQSMASQYFKDKLSINPVTRDVVQRFEPPSSNERHRLQCALYHFEIYCCLYSSHHLPWLSFHEERVRVSDYEYYISQRHLLLLDVADAEGVACLREYFFGYYTKLMSSTCEAELQRLNSSPPDWMPSLEVDSGSTYFPSWETPKTDREQKEYQKKEYWMSLGLRFFQRVSQAPTAEAQAQILFQNPWRRHQFLSEAVIGGCRIPRRPSRGCAAHPPGYDHQSNPDQGPRLAPWWKTWDRGFSNYDRVYLQSFGYAFWDQQRLDAWRMTEKSPVEL